MSRRGAKRPTKQRRPRQLRVPCGNPGKHTCGICRRLARRDPPGCVARRFPVSTLIERVGGKTLGSKRNQHGSIQPWNLQVKIREAAPSTSMQKQNRSSRGARNARPNRKCMSVHLDAQPLQRRRGLAACRHLSAKDRNGQTREAEPHVRG